MKCLHCGAELIIKEGKERIHPKRKYCNFTCQTRYNARINYHKNKDKPWFKLKQKKSFNKWRLANKEHFNALMRIPSKLYQQRIISERRIAGTCLDCGKERANYYHGTIKTVRCMDCLEKRRVVAKERYNRLKIIKDKKQNLCV